MKYNFGESRETNDAKKTAIILAIVSAVFGAVMTWLVHFVIPNLPLFVILIAYLISFILFSCVFYYFVAYIIENPFGERRVP